MSANRSIGLFGKLYVRLIVYALFAAMALLLRTGCAVHSPAHSPDDTTKNNTGAAFTSTEYGMRLPYPNDLKLQHDFGSGYLASDSWKTYAGVDAAPGQQLVALIMPRSNDVTTGALRIGVSRNDTAVRHCTDMPAAALADSVHETTLDGVVFTTYKARDAGMSHYLIVRSYRGVDDATCYALDVLVYGTNPRVYEPPKTSPFTAKQVFARLIPVVENLQL